MKQHLTWRTTSGVQSARPTARVPQPVRSARSPQAEGTSHRPRRVLFYTAAVAMQDWGGGEVQLLKTAEHLQKLGVEARALDPWRDRLQRGDWLHLFGTLAECLAMARLAGRRCIPVALSPISWYNPWTDWNVEPTWGRKLRGLASWSTRRVFPRFPSWRRELIGSADLLLPNSKAEADQLIGLFGTDQERIVVVPNGVDRRFDHGDAELFRARFGVRDFVLVPGRIEPRKNQLAVIRALWGSGIPLVVLGDPHPFHLEYYERCRREADPAVTFVPRIEHDDPLLASAYAAARVVVQASWYETPGLAALEGALAGAQVVITELGATKEYFGLLARYVRPDDLAQLRQQLRAAMAMPRQTELRDLVRRQYLWDAVAKQTWAAYQRARPRGTAGGAHPQAAAA